MNIIKQLAKEYNVKPKALKRYSKEQGFKTKDITELSLLTVLIINCTDLFYCREDEVGTVEYLDKQLIKKLLKRYKHLKNKYQKSGVYYE